MRLEHALHREQATGDQAVTLPHRCGVGIRFGARGVSADISSISLVEHGPYRGRAVRKVGQHDSNKPPSGTPGIHLLIF